MNSISLNGIWSFRTVSETDSNGRTIKVPGGWKMLDEFKNYNGSAIYERSFSLTDEQTKKVVAVCFGGVFRYADIYINDNFVIRHEGYQSAFEADISRFVKCGENRIKVIADNVSKSYDMMDGSTLWGMEPMRFSGIYESVWIELRERIRTSDVYASLTKELDLIEVKIEAENLTEKAADVEFIIEIKDQGTEETVKKCSVLRTLASGKTTFCVDFDADEIKLWSPENSNLYEITVNLTGCDFNDTYIQRTGFKYFAIKGKDFYLNGHPFFLRGYGDDFVFPLTAHPSATDKTYYYHGLKRAKEYGFNGARHHSHFPFSPFFEAADELGMLIQPELAMANIPIDRFTKESAEFFIKEWKALIKEHRHHPCIMAWCGGNEEEWGYFFEREIYKTAKENDPYRPVMPTDGRWMAKETENDSNYDYVSVCYAEGTDVLALDEYSDLYSRDDCGKPQIVHEAGNFTTLVPINDLPKYKNAINYPFKWEEWKNKIQTFGRTNLYEKAAENAFEMQKLCYKLTIEKIRMSDAIRGYHLWTLTDFYDTTQGILNQFYEDKAFTAEEFSRLNASSLLLWNTERYCFFSGEKADFEICLSRFENEDLPSAKLNLTVSCGDEAILSKQFEVDIKGHGTMPLKIWAITLPECNSAQRLCFCATLDCGKKSISNSWDLWIYPEKAADIATGREIYIHYLSRHLLEHSTRSVRHFTIPMPINGNIIVTGFLFNGMLDEVYKGARMLLIAQPDTFKATVQHNSFKPCWWSQSEFFFLNRTNNTQTSNILENHPALKDIPHKNHTEINWYHLTEQQHAIETDKLPFEVTPIVYGLGPELEKRGYLFEFAYGEGAILVSTLNFDKTNLKHPETKYTFECLLNYCDSDSFSPEHQVTPEQLNEALN